jgi:hypothetical protein
MSGFFSFFGFLGFWVLWIYNSTLKTILSELPACRQAGEL